MEQWHEKSIVYRAYRVDKTFSLTGENASDVARMCRLVEGMPLYIELAASRAHRFSVVEIVDALETTAVLPGSTKRDVPQRHASFAAVFDQSWDLLETRDQIALTRLTATRGGFDRRAAHAPDWRSRCGEFDRPQVSARRGGCRPLPLP